jgi:hypothetical protein
VKHLKAGFLRPGRKANPWPDVHGKYEELMKVLLILVVVSVKIERPLRGASARPAYVDSSEGAGTLGFESDYQD